MTIEEQQRYVTELTFTKKQETLQAECRDVGARPHLGVHMPQGKEYMLIDTGSVANLIPEKMLMDYERKAGKERRMNTNIKLIAQNNTSVQISSKVLLTIGIDSSKGIQQFQVPFYVSTAPDSEGILGTNFLRYISATIIYGKTSARLAYLGPLKREAQIATVELVKGVVVKPGQRIVAFAVEQPPEENGKDKGKDLPTSSMKKETRERKLYDTTLEEDQIRQEAKNPTDTQISFCESGTIDGRASTLPTHETHNEGKDGGEYPPRPGDTGEIAQNKASTGVLWPRRRTKNDELRNKEERFLGTGIYGKQPLPTRHDSHLPESSKGGMHCEIGDLYNEEETPEYLEEDRTNKSKLGNLEEGYESNNEENEERIGNEKNEREVVLKEENFAPHTSEKEPRGDDFVGRKVLLHASLPGPRQAIAKFHGRVLPFLIQNDTESELQYPAGTPVGTVELMPSEAVEIPLSNMFSTIRTFSTVKLKNAYQCFCKKASAVHPIYKIYFLQSETETSFRNKSIYQEEPDYLTKATPYWVSGDDIFIGPNLGRIREMDIKIMMAPFDVKTAVFVICITDYGELTIAEHDIIGFLSKFSRNIQIEYYKPFSKNSTSLCKLHAPVSYPKTTRQFKITLLAGENEPIVKGKNTFNFNIAETKIAAHETSDAKGDPSITLLMHVPEAELENQNYLVSLYHQILYDISRTQGRGRMLSVWLTSTSPCGGAYKVRSALERVTPPINICYLPTIEDKERSRTVTFTAHPECPCVSCKKEIEKRERIEKGIYKKYEDEEKIIYEKGQEEHTLAHGMNMCQKEISDHENQFGNDAKGGRVSHVAVNSGLQTELLNDSDERYSVVTNLDDKLDLPEVFRDQFDAVELKDMEQIYEGCPESERQFYEELFDMFSFLLTNDNTKIRVIRDRRVAVPLKFEKEVPKTKQVFPASAPMTTRIVHIFEQMALKGLAKEVDEAEFVSPTFLKVLSRSDLEQLKKDPLAPVKTRLISSYVQLNKYVQDIPTQLPIIREMITTLSSYPYLGTADLQQAYRSFPLEEEATEYLALSAPTGKVFKILILVEGVTNAVRFADRAISDSLVFCDPAEKDKIGYGNEKPWITNMKLLKEALERPNNGDMPESRTRDAITWKEVPQKLKDMTIEKTRIKMEKEFKTPQIIRLAEVSHDIRVTTKCTTNFLDDLYIFARTKEDFRKALTSLMIDSSNHGYLYNVKKFRPFSIMQGKGQCKILGYQLKDRTIKPLPNKNNPIADMAYPTSVRGMMKCLGTFQYLAPHIHSLTSLSAPLYELIAGKPLANKILLSKELKTIFDILKNRACDLEALYLPLPEDSLILTTDASHTAVGACLTAVTTNQEIKTVSYFSKMLPSSNRKQGGSLYKEAIGLALALYYFRFYVYSNPCCVLTDASALVALIVYSKSKNSILQRLATRISSYPIDYIYHIAGTDNVAADVLSRIPKFKLETPEMVFKKRFQELDATNVNVEFLPRNQRMPFSELEELTLENIEEVLSTGGDELKDVTKEITLPDEVLYEKNLHNAILSEAPGLTSCVSRARYDNEADENFPEIPSGKNGIASVNRDPMEPITFDWLVQMQGNSTVITQQIKALKKGQAPKHLQKYSLNKGELLTSPGPLGPRVRCSKEMCARILVQLHFLGHLSIKKLAKVFSRYFSTNSNIQKLAKAVVKSCHRCLRFKSLQHHDYKDGRTHRGKEPLEHLVFDHIVLSKHYYANGKQINYIFSVCDTFSGFLFTFPQTSINNAAVIRDLLSIKAIFGFASNMSLTCDNSTSFKSNEMTKFYETNGLKIHYVLPYGSKGAGIIENRNRQIRQTLALEMEDDKNFIQALADATNYLNKRPTSDSLLSPYELFHGKSKFSFLNEKEDRLVNDAIANEQYRLSKLEKTNVQPRQEIREGDYILVKATFTGPVDKQDGKYLNQTFKVVRRDGHRIRYASLDDQDKSVYECHVKYVRKCCSTDHPLLRDLTIKQKERLWGDLYYKNKQKSENEESMSQAKSSEKDNVSQIGAPTTSVGEMNKTKTAITNQEASPDSCRATVGTKNGKNETGKEVNTSQKENGNQGKYELRKNERINYGNFRELNERKQARYRKAPMRN